MADSVWIGYDVEISHGLVQGTLSVFTWTAWRIHWYECLGRELCPGPPEYEAGVLTTIPRRLVVSCYTLLCFVFCPSRQYRKTDIVRLRVYGPQRWATWLSRRFFYSCSGWVFVLILWCGDSENNLAVIPHYLQKHLNELISEGQRLFLFTMPCVSVFPLCTSAAVMAKRLHFSQS